MNKPIRRKPQISYLHYAKNSRTGDYGIMYEFADATPVLYNATQDRWEKTYETGIYDYEYLIDCTLKFLGIAYDEIEDYVRGILEADPNGQYRSCEEIYIAGRKTDEKFN